MQSPPGVTTCSSATSPLSSKSDSEKAPSFSNPPKSNVEKDPSFFEQLVRIGAAEAGYHTAAFAAEEERTVELLRQKTPEVDLLGLGDKPCLESFLSTANSVIWADDNPLEVANFSAHVLSGEVGLTTQRLLTKLKEKNGEFSENQAKTHALRLRVYMDVACITKVFLYICNGKLEDFEHSEEKLRGKMANFLKLVKGDPSIVLKSQVFVGACHLPSVGDWKKLTVQFTQLKRRYEELEAQLEEQRKRSEEQGKRSEEVQGLLQAQLEELRKLFTASKAELR